MNMKTALQESRQESPQSEQLLYKHYTSWSIPETDKRKSMPSYWQAISLDPLIKPIKVNPSCDQSHLTLWDTLELLRPFSHYPLHVKGTPSSHLGRIYHSVPDRRGYDEVFLRERFVSWVIDSRDFSAELSNLNDKNERGWNVFCYLKYDEDFEQTKAKYESSLQKLIEKHKEFNITLDALKDH